MSREATRSVGTAVRDAIERRGSSSLLLFPLVAFMLVFFLIPFLILLRISFARPTPDGTYVPGTVSLEAFLSIPASSVLRHVILFSFGFGAVATVFSVTIGFVYAYAIWRADGLLTGVLLFSVVLPLLTTLVIRTYAWLPLLTPTGTVNEALLSVGLLAEPFQFAPGFVGALLGQVYVITPYVVLAIYSVLATTDWELVEAARDLGASRPASIVHVVVPHAMPGVVVGTVIAFAWNVGSYAAPALLGGGRERTFAIEVERQVLRQFDWALGSALAMLMLAAVLVAIVIIVAVLGRFGGDLEYAE